MTIISIDNLVPCHTALHCGYKNTNPSTRAALHWRFNKSAGNFQRQTEMAEGGGEKRGAFLLVSKTGGGKSSLANALLNTTEFPVGRGMLSSTAHCKCISTHARGRDLTVVDTPGTMDVGDKAKAETEIKRAIGFCPDGFDIFLLVIKCDSRFTDEEKLAVDVVSQMFGEKFYNHAIVVFSHGDDYDNEEAEFKKDLEKIRLEIPYLNELLGKCGNRFVLVDNGRKCDKAVQDRQIEALLALSDSLMSSNGDRKFTSEHFESAQKKQQEAEKKKAEEAAEAERKRQEEMRQLMRQESRTELDARRRSEEELMDRRATQQMVLGLANGIMQFASAMVSSAAATPEPDYRVQYAIGVTHAGHSPGLRLRTIESSDDDSD